MPKTRNTMIQPTEKDVTGQIGQVISFTEKSLEKNKGANKKALSQLNEILTHLKEIQSLWSALVGMKGEIEVVSLTSGLYSVNV